MSTPIWRGDAPAIAQIETITVANTWATADTAVITINGKSLTMTVGAVATTTGIATALAAMFNGDAAVGTETRSETGDNIPEFNEITAEASGSDVILTHDTPGVPFVVSVSETTAGSGTLATTTTLAASGPNWWSTAANWSTGSVPVDTDDVIIANSDVDILYGLAQSSIQPATLTIDQSYTGRIGLPVYNANGYYEYRATYLAIGAVVITIGNGIGSGSGRLKINSGTDVVTMNVRNTGQPEDDDLPAVIWKGSNASNEVNVNRGSLGAAVLPGETATIATLRVGYVESIQTDASVRCGSGVTLTTVAQTGGSLETASAITTLSILDGDHTHKAGAVTTLNLDGGTEHYQSNGTLGTANVGSTGVLDFRQDMRPRTVSNCNLYERGELHDPFRTVTWTNGIDLVRCSVEEVVLDIGTHLTLTPSNI